MKPAQAAERIATACQDAIGEAHGERWDAAEDLLREATNLAAGMTSRRIAISPVTSLKNTGPRHSQSTERCFLILALFTEQHPIWGVVEVADDLGFSRGTTHRYMTTLVAIGQLEQVAGRRYKRVGRPEGPGTAEVLDNLLGAARKRSLTIKGYADGTFEVVDAKTDAVRWRVTVGPDGELREESAEAPPEAA